MCLISIFFIKNSLIIFIIENFGNAYDHLETEIVLRKRLLKKKVRLFNFGNSSQTSATVVNFCNGSQTLEMGIQKVVFYFGPNFQCTYKKLNKWRQKIIIIIIFSTFYKFYFIDCNNDFYYITI